MAVPFRFWNLTCPRCKAVSLQQTRWFLRGILESRNDVPSAEKIPRTHSVHGVLLRDDLAWLRDRENKDVTNYIKAENRYTKKILRNTEDFQQELIEEMSHWSNQTEPTESVPEQLDGYIYYIRTAPDDNLPVYCRRKILSTGNHGPPEIILDQNELAEKFGYISIPVIKLSPSRKLAAFLLDSTGLEQYSCQVMEVTPGEPLKIVDVLPSVVNFEWGTNENTLFYTFPDHVKRPHQVWMHRIGQPAEDTLIFEEKDERFFLDVSATKDRRFITINSNSKSTSEVSVVNGDNGSFVHRPVQPREAGTEYYVEHRGDEFYIITNANRPNYRVVRTSDKDSRRENWEEFISHTEEVIVDDMDIFENHCVLYGRRWTRPQVSVVSLASPKENCHTIQLPHEACVIEPGSNQMFDSNTVRFSVSSPILPPKTLEFNMNTGETVELGSLAGGKQSLDMSQYLCVRHKFTSADGVSVPVTLFHHKDVRRDGDNPLLANVYGAYGVNVNMNFSPDWLCLLSRGWIVAFLHVRGGGELGRGWYHQGRLRNKHKSFEDFEASVHALHAMKYSTPRLTAARGVSAGGLVLGAVCNRSPGLLSAAILKVPFLDILTAMLDPSLPLTAQEYEEWGDPRSNKDDLLYIRSYCPFQNIKNQKYPSVLVTGSTRDERVPYWLPLKWTAKLRAVLRDRPRTNSNAEYSSSQASATTPRGPADSPLVLCRMDFEGGHFGSGGLHGTFVEAAEEFAFLHKAMGLPAAGTRER